MKTINTKFNKTVLAMLLSVIGATASMSAIANMSEDKVKVHKLKINKALDNNVNVYVNNNGETNEFIFSTDDLSSRENVEKLLASLPVEIREHITGALVNNEGVDGLVKLHKVLPNTKVFNWTTSDNDDKVLVLKGDESIEINSDDDHHMMKFHFVSGNQDIEESGKLHADIITKLIQHGEFTQDDLDKLQQAIDAKR